MNNLRARFLTQNDFRMGPVVYWMSRDQRMNDNWALCRAQSDAIGKKVPLYVVFCLKPRFLDATRHHYTFMLKGLQELELSLKGKNIPFFLLLGDAVDVLPAFIEEYNVGTLFTDYSPLRHSRAERSALAAGLRIPIIEVDAHNIVPVRVASAKLEYGAYTIRPKLQRLLPEFLEEFPAIEHHPFVSAAPVPAVHWEHAASSLMVDTHTGAVCTSEPGETVARAVLKEFIAAGLAGYGTYSNDPALDAQSRLSPYLHFGHIGAQRIALDVQHTTGVAASAEFMEQLVVRRELADNFCQYNDRYDSFEGFPAWAQRSLNDHRRDKRAFLYSLEQFECADTHDELWNAAQRQMLTTGRMHGYMRMYWAKKILEWSASPEEAFTIAVYLNDTYELDGRDPNGYAGIAWSIGGVHDRAWFDRPVFGKIRYMNANGCARKFDVKKYCDRHGKAVI